MGAIEELKEAYAGQLDAKIFPTYLKAIEETLRTSDELKTKITGFGDIVANFTIKNAGVSAHLKIKLQVLTHGGEGVLYKNPDVAFILDEDTAKDMALNAAKLTTVLMEGALTGEVKFDTGKTGGSTKLDLGLLMRVTPIMDELNKLSGASHEDAFSDSARRLVEARKSDACDTSIFKEWLKVSEGRSEIDPLFPRYERQFYKSWTPLKMNFKVPSAEIIGYFGLEVRRSITCGDGLLDSPDVTVELTGDVARNLIKGETNLKTAYNLGYLEIDRRSVGKLVSLDSLFSIANEEMGLKDLRVNR